MKKLLREKKLLRDEEKAKIHKKCVILKFGSMRNGEKIKIDIYSLPANVTWFSPKRRKKYDEKKQITRGEEKPEQRRILEQRGIDKIGEGYVGKGVEEREEKGRGEGWEGREHREKQEEKIKLDDLKPPYMFFAFSFRKSVPKKIISEIAKQNKKLSKIGVLIPESESEKKEKSIEKLMRKEEIDLPVVKDDGGEICSMLGIRELPAIVLSDEAGNITERIEGNGEILKKVGIPDSPYLIGSIFHDIELKVRSEELPPEEIFSYDESKKFNPFVFPGHIAFSESRKIMVVSDLAGNGTKSRIFFLTWRFFELLKVIGGKWDEIQDIYFDDRAEKLLLCDGANCRVFALDINEGKIAELLYIPLPKSVSASAELIFVSSSLGKIYVFRKKDMYGYDGVRDKKIQAVKEIEGFMMPSHVLPVSDQTVFIADSGDSSIKRFDMQEGRITTIAGGNGEGHKDGPASSSMFSCPTYIDIYRDVFFICDTLNNSLRILSDEKVYTMFLKNTELFEPECVKIIRGSIIVSDTGNDRLLQIDSISQTAEEIYVEMR